MNQEILEGGKLPSGVHLWSITPNFSKRRFRRHDLFCKYIDYEIYEKSSDKCNLILWMDPFRFSQIKFWYPDFDKWIRHGIVVSGSGRRMMFGIAFSKTDGERWGKKIIWSENGGQKCSHTCRWMLEKTKGLVCDPYAQSPVLARWCRQLSLPYAGYTKNQRVLKEIKTELAQLPIPGIQTSLPNL